MGEDGHVPPLSRRVPGATGRNRPKPAVRGTPQKLPEALLQRMQAAIDAASERAAGQQAACSDRPAASLAARTSAPEDLTQPIPIILGSAKNDTVSPAVEEISAQPAPAAELEPAEETADLERAATWDLAAEPELAEERADPERAAATWDLAAELELAGETAEAEQAAEPEPAEETLADQERAAATWALAERMAMQQASEREAARRRYRIVSAFMSVIILVATGSLVFVLFQHGAAAPGGSPATQAVIRNRAAAWVAAQVSRAATVSCDPVMCAALKAHGIAAGRLLELRLGTADLLRSDVIVATPAVGGQFGSRLSSFYAPAVIASFGSGPSRIDIRAIAPHGAAAYWSAASADLRARKVSGAPLLSSNRITVSAAARKQLSAGQVDSRLLVTIVAMAAQQPVQIVAFGDAGPGAGAGSPLRSAELAEATGLPHLSTSAYMRSMLAFLRAQRGYYAPASVTQTRLAGGLPVLSIEFAAPSPLGLISPSIP